MGSRVLTLLFLLTLLSTPALAAESPNSQSSADQPVAARAIRPVAPVEVFIPALGVDADVVPVGEDSDGAMGSPTDPDTVAWWSLGYGTGEDPGNVVLAGHVNWLGRLRPFGLIDQLAPGDEIVLHDELGREYHYQVTWSKLVEAEGAPVEEIFSPSDRAELTLITCGGTFVPATREYLDRTIVRAVKV
jgi:LPXTG-site transpeptidase (sortase) family protein